VDDVREAGIELVATSSPEDPENLFIREYAKVARIITRIIRDQSHAEDLAVEVFLKVSRPKSDMAKAASMLYRQAVRMALDEVRRRNRRQRLRQLFSSFLAADDNPEKEYALRQRQLHVGLVLQGLRQRDAELLVLRAEGLTYAELSNALSINPASVGIMLSRAQFAFKKEYLKRYGQPDS
jgi:RNA polymerase sigma-70 factor (ECF subfamily)